MRKWWIVTVFLPLLSFGQQNFTFLHTFYKDALLSPSVMTKADDGFFPKRESQFTLDKAFKDSTVFYYEFLDVLFKKHAYETTEGEVKFAVSPILDGRAGEDFVRNDDELLFQNTRGFYVQVDLGTKISFSTSLFENQARFSTFESDYIISRGEFYFKTNLLDYRQDNGVVPGAARTKPFKDNGFDYAFAIGNFTYQPKDWWTISIGNNRHFIGSGYRSLLLSDNSGSAPYLRSDFKIGKLFSFHYLRAQGLNLVRKRQKTTVEAYYQPKGIAINYLTFTPHKSVAISLFDGGIWRKGDSLVTSPVNPMYFNPIPFLGNIMKDSTLLSIQGINLDVVLSKNFRLYGQYAMTELDKNKQAFQVGIRMYDLFKIKKSLVQLEFNHVDAGMYEKAPLFMSYSHYNLPLAHPKGSGFNEFVVRSTYEWKRLYYDFRFIYYQLRQYNDNVLLPIQLSPTSYDNDIIYSNLEVGYRMNKKMNLDFFVNLLMRNPTRTSNDANGCIYFGMKTAILNHYNDY